MFSIKDCVEYKALEREAKNWFSVRGFCDKSHAESYLAFRVRKLQELLDDPYRAKSIAETQVESVMNSNAERFIATLRSNFQQEQKSYQAEISRLCNLVNKLRAEQPFAIGDVVRLNSGGPEMTIAGIGPKECKCQWFACNTEEPHEVDILKDAVTRLIDGEKPAVPMSYTPSAITFTTKDLKHW